MIIQAQKKHLPAINRIYNGAVAAGWQTAHTEPLSPAEREEWFGRHNPEIHPVFVDLRDKQVTGWVSVSPYRKGRGALSGVAEISYYVDEHHRRKGIGGGLVKHALDFCQKTGFRIAVAILIEGNTASTELLEKFGFTRWGAIPEAIRYEGAFRDHLYMGLKLQ